MKYFIFLIIIFFTTNVFALNVYYNKNTGQVMTITSNTVILSATDQQAISSATLPANFDINTLMKPFPYYNYSNGNIVLNTAMILADENAQVALATTQKTQQATQASAIAKLTDAISKVSTADVLTQAEMNALLPTVNVAIGTTSSSTVTIGTTP